MFLFRSPAKINLFLSVIGKRNDGYHELASLFQAVSLFDTLKFELSEKDSFTCSDPSLSLDNSNLVMKALHLFRKKSKLSFSVRIHLDKQIPKEAGLGGGSSNAATTLFALNKIFHSPFDNSVLQEWSSEIGSDVPFFFSKGTALCRGRGEIVHNVNPFHLNDITIAKPPIGLSTPTVFQHMQVSQLKKRNIEEYLKSGQNYEFFNDLEEAAFSVEPGLKNFKIALLNAGFHTVHMTGSGSAFFCLGSGQNLPFGIFYNVSTVKRDFHEQWY